MVKYLREQDAYKAFLVGGHVVSRSNVGEAGSKTQGVWNKSGGDTAHSTSQYYSSFSLYCTRIDCSPEKPKL